MDVKWIKSMNQPSVYYLSPTLSQDGLFLGVISRGFIYVDDEIHIFDTSTGDYINGFNYNRDDNTIEWYNSELYRRIFVIEKSLTTTQFNVYVFFNLHNDSSTSIIAKVLMENDIAGKGVTTTW